MTQPRLRARIEKIIAKWDDGKNNYRGRVIIGELQEALREAALADNPAPQNYALGASFDRGPNDDAPAESAAPAPSSEARCPECGNDEVKDGHYPSCSWWKRTPETPLPGQTSEADVRAAIAAKLRKASNAALSVLEERMLLALAKEIESEQCVAIAGTDAAPTVCPEETPLVGPLPTTVSQGPLLTGTPANWEEIERAARREPGPGDRAMDWVRLRELANEWLEMAPWRSKECSDLLNGCATDLLAIERSQTPQANSRSRGNDS